MAAVESGFRGYRAAVALNNMGVLLLERGSPLQALETFHDALATVRHVLVLGSEGSSSTTSQHVAQIQDLDTRLLTARERLKCCNGRETVYRVDSLTNGEEDLLNHFDSLVKGVSPSPLTMNPLRIYSSGPDTPDCTDLDIDAAVILYNFGLACLRESRNLKSYLASSLNAFLPAQAILFKRFEKIQHSSSLQLPRLLIVAAMIISSTIDVLRLQGNSRDAEVESARLSSLLTEINSMDKTHLVRSLLKTLNVAAAA